MWERQWSGEGWVCGGGSGRGDVWREIGKRGECEWGRRYFSVREGRKYSV